MSNYAKAMVPTRGAAARRMFSPFPELLELQKLFSTFADERPDASPSNWSPAADVFETENEIQIAMDLPDIKREDVQLNLEGQTLTISGERKLEFEDRRENYHRVERAHGRFGRSFTIPSNVDREALKAEYREGVLRITLPKRAESKARQITID